MSSRFFLRRKSQIYAAMAFIVPAIIFAIGSVDLLAPLLVGATTIIASMLLLPRYVKLIVRVEDAINHKLARLTPSRLVRIGFHIPWVLGIYQLIGSTWRVDHVEPYILLLLIAASNGLHAIAISLAYRGRGERIGNILLSFSLSAWLTAIALVSPYGIYAAALAVIAFAVHIVSGILSDLRAYFYPETGIGVFFGTFNPVHNTHLRIMKDALENRGLHKIYLHPTTVPKLHRTALESGEIAMTYQAGMRVYKKTPLADPSKNYFPTGNKFYEYEVRKELLKASIRDAGLENKVEVLDLPHIYDHAGFFGLLRHIKQQNRGMPVHGLHGSDTGGIWVRHIFDASGWIYPCPIIRSDNISATAIREGAVGYTSATVEQFLAAVRAEKDFVFPSGYVFKNSGNFPQ
jgi:hypothetical protein